MAAACLPLADGKEKNRLGPRREDDPPNVEKSSEERKTSHYQRLSDCLAFSTSQ